MPLADPLRHMDDLLDLPYVKECAIHGSTLHVLVKDQAGADQLTAFTKVQPKIITPTLDDVFIALAKSQESELGGNHRETVCGIKGAAKS